MSFKDELLGDTAPSRAPYQDFGRFRVTVGGGKVWIRDTESDEAGQPFNVKEFESALATFYSRRF